MTKANFYRNLKIDTPFDKEILIKDLSKEILSPDRIFMCKRWGYRDPIFSNPFHQLLDNLSCYVANAEIFYIPSNKQLEWHIDMYPPMDFVKINFVWNSDNHSMMWGKCINEDKKISISLTQMDTEYVKYEDKEIKPLESVKISEKFPALVNVGIPHKVVNISPLPRWCFSIVPHHNNKRILFDDALKIFKNYIVTID